LAVKVIYLKKIVTILHIILKANFKEGELKTKAMIFNSYLKKKIKIVLSIRQDQQQMKEIITILNLLESKPYQKIKI
jgi:hypothetical protein